jgi:hypothetical protein
MKIKVHMVHIICLSLLFAFAAIIPTSAFAWAGKLSTLTLAFPDGTPPETQEKVRHYLDLTFVEGEFMNQHITQRFSGSADHLSELIQMLHTNRFELKVEFADLKDERVSFSLYQMMGAGAEVEATITINTAKKDFNWSELKFQIPPAKRNIEPDVSPKAPTTNKPK